MAVRDGQVWGGDQRRGLSNRLDSMVGGRENRGPILHGLHAAEHMYRAVAHWNGDDLRRAGEHYAAAVVTGLMPWHRHAVNRMMDGD